MSLEKKITIAGGIAGIIGTAVALVAYKWPPASPASDAPPSVQVPVTIVNSPNIQVTTPVGAVPALQGAYSPRGQRQYEDSLSWLSTGISRASLVERFGTPRFETGADAVFKASVLTFVFPRFFLQAILSSDGTVMLYSVTTRTSDFRPTIPKLGGHLLDSRYVSFGDAELRRAYMSSKYFEYLEKIDRGNLTNFRSIFLGYCPSGALLDSQTTIEETDAKKDPARLAKFR